MSINKNLYHSEDFERLYKENPEQAKEIYMKSQYPEFEKYGPLFGLSNDSDSDLLLNNKYNSIELYLISDLKS